MAGEAPHPLVKVFSCPNCGAGVTLRAQGRSVTAVCGSCQAAIDVANENLTVIAAAASKMVVEPEIPLGSRGRLYGDLWEVIGFMERCDGTMAYRWQEYLLFNPYKGYRWLVEDNGHWNFVRMVREQPLGDYKLFNTGTAMVTFVLGEFYWRVARGDKYNVRDLIDPPRIISEESDASERMWSVGEYVEPEVIRQAFQLKTALRPRSGIAPNQPSKARAAWEGSRVAWGAFAATMVVIQMATVHLSPGAVVYRQQLTYDPAYSQLPTLVPDLDLGERRSNLRIQFAAPVNNGWLEFDGSLTAADGTARDFEIPLEYYSGYDGDGYWSEGTTRPTELLSSVPGGKYSLSFQVTGPDHPPAPGPSPSPPAEPWTQPRSARAIDYTVQIERGVISFSNFFCALLLVSAYPLIAWARSQVFEGRRWSSSDYSPYATHGGNDE